MNTTGPVEFPKMDIEPNIISHEMLETAIKNQSKQGELDFSSVLKIRLEFQSKLLSQVMSPLLHIIVIFCRYFKNRSSVDVKKSHKTIVEL